jgi:uncharacterized membrane protein YkoI
MTTKTKRITAVAATCVGLGLGAAAIASAGGDDDGSDKAITGSALKSASDAALRHTGGGRVSGTEVGDEESYYEVEVTNPDGSQTDVQLNRDFKVVGAKTDDGDSAGDR